MKPLRLKTNHFHPKLPYQKPILRQIKWWRQNGPIPKKGVLPVTTLFFWKFCFSLRTSYEELICYTNNPNDHICTFCNRWSFIWQWFFPVSIHKAFRHQNLPFRLNFLEMIYFTFQNKSLSPCSFNLMWIKMQRESPSLYQRISMI